MASALSEVSDGIAKGQHQQHCKGEHEHRQEKIPELGFSPSSGDAKPFHRGRRRRIHEPHNRYCSLTDCLSVELLRKRVYSRRRRYFGTLFARFAFKRASFSTNKRSISFTSSMSFEGLVPWRPAHTIPSIALCLE